MEIRLGATRSPLETCLLSLCPLPYIPAPRWKLFFGLAGPIYAHSIGRAQTGLVIPITREDFAAPLAPENLLRLPFVSPISTTTTYFACIMRLPVGTSVHCQDLPVAANNRYPFLTERLSSTGTLPTCSGNNFATTSRSWKEFKSGSHGPG